MGKKSKKKRVGVVYSTNPDYDYDYESKSEEDEPPANQQRLRVMIDRKGRGGKEVTLVTGFVGPDDARLGQLIDRLGANGRRALPIGGFAMPLVVDESGAEARPA